MLINFTQNLLDVDGNPVPELFERIQEDGSTKRERRNLTLRSVAVAALNANFQDEAQQKNHVELSKIKFERGELAFKIYNNDTLDLESEQISEIKKLVGRIFSPVIVWRAYKMLEGKTQ